VLLAATRLNPASLFSGNSPRANRSMTVSRKSSSSILSSNEMSVQRSLPSLSTASLAVIAIRLRVALGSLIRTSLTWDSDRVILSPWQRHEQEAAMSITERDVVPCEDDREFLVDAGNGAWPK
jgi:hypothetical protein